MCLSHSEYFHQQVCNVLNLHSSRSWESTEKERPRRDAGGQTRERSVFVFGFQWCVTSLSHPADCLPSSYAHTWAGMILPATRSTFTALQWLSNNSTTQCHRPTYTYTNAWACTLTHTHTHVLQNATASTMNAHWHKCSWSWNVWILKDDPINVQLYHCDHHFSLSHLASPRQYINDFQCNYRGNQLQPL